MRLYHRIWSMTCFFDGQEGPSLLPWIHPWRGATKLSGPTKFHMPGSPNPSQPNLAQHALGDTTQPNMLSIAQPSQTKPSMLWVAPTQPNQQMHAWVCHPNSPTCFQSNCQNQTHSTLLCESSSLTFCITTSTSVSLGAYRTLGFPYSTCTSTAM